MPLSDDQLAYYAYQAGFRGADLRRAVAIAKAESAGNPGAYNPETAAGTKPGAGSYGLWQIYSTAHPQYNRAQLADPAYNAKAAFEVYRAAGNRFTPWSTWTQGIAQRIEPGLKFSLKARKPNVSTRMAAESNIPARTRSQVGPSVVSLAAGSSGSAAPAYTQIRPGVLSPLQGLQSVAGVASAAPEEKTGNPIAEGIKGAFEGLFPGRDFAFYLGGGTLIVIGLIILGVSWAAGPGKETVVDLAKVAGAAAL